MKKHILNITCNHLRILFLAMLFMAFITASAFAAVTATYDAETNIVFKVKPAPYTSNDVLGAKLGRFTIVSDTGEIHSPVLANTTRGPNNSNPINSVMLNGSMKTWDNGGYNDNNHAFYVQALVYKNGLGAPPSIAIPYGRYVPLLGNSSITTNVLYVDIFLVNFNDPTILNPSLTYGPAKFFKPDSPYTFIDEFNPHFAIVTANSPGIDPGGFMDGTTGKLKNPKHNPNAASYVEVNHKTGSDPTQIVDPEGPTVDEGNGGFIFGDPPAPVSYVLTFANPSPEISLQDGNGVGSSARFEVNEALMNLYNTKPDKTYSVRIKIKDDSPSPTSFQLLPEQSGPNPINYNLYWGTTTSNAQEVVKNDEIDWRDLKESTNPNARKLYIGNISANDVAKAASGTYKSTITIEIISKN